MSSSNKVYLPGLNGLRFFAAYAVIITHTELLKMVFGYPNIWLDPIVFNLGGLGVVFFFVLSGFLITLLLFIEKERTGNVAIRAFYIRRILRIWPLYYLIVILGFFVLPHFDQLDISYLDTIFHKKFWQQFAYYFFISPNLSYSIYLPTPHIGQLWSIGVEEQFYLLWPLLVYYSKKPAKVFLLVIVGLVLLKSVALFFKIQYPCPSVLIVAKFLAMSKFECMAIGALGAYVLHRELGVLLSIIYNKIVQLICWLLIPFLIYFTPDIIQDGIHMVYSVVFIVVILNVSTNKRSWLKLNHKYFDTLGNISYGIYMYHMLIIPIVLLALKPLYIICSGLWVWNIAVYLTVSISTIAISYLSYIIFESYFLKMKNKFTKVKSGSTEFDK